MSVNCVQKKASKIIPTEKDIIKANKLAFGDDIGTTTNYITSQICLLSEFENDPKKIWESNIFGKSLHELVNEGLQNKLAKMPEEAQCKLQETLQRIVNEGSGGLICIIL